MEPLEGSPRRLWPGPSTHQSTDQPTSYPTHQLTVVRGQPPSSACSGNPCCLRPTSASCLAVRLVQLEAAVRRLRGAARRAGAASRAAPIGRKPRAMPQVLPQHAHRVDAADGASPPAGSSRSAALPPAVTTRFFTACRPRRRASSCRSARCPAARHSGSTCCSKLRKVASKQLSGIWQVSNGKPCDSICEVDRRDPCGR